MEKEIMNLAREYYIDNGYHYSGACPFHLIQNKLNIDIYELRNIVNQLQSKGLATEICVDAFWLVLSKKERKKLILEHTASKLINKWCQHPHQLPRMIQSWSEKEIKTVFSLKPSYLD
ncbi:hypothetical protein IMZ31_19585 (plasmid) [Pontibacillus sp. ALD_SL1]|uniref:hypothetical protein n=1 Tax=Pontibacillus sp. ALD_SL1 TaxID=2777185 RepID=UPI001A95B4BB|nr:hypothetical protein [Pontibacillus sp. ALD_SL1]QST02754.1 hypothetical protein IMZ31_19585 [Pontibacillus sp. ALD_SL1]